MNSLKGDILRRSNIEIASDTREVVFAQKLFASRKDEDATPIAQKVDLKSYFLFVADGMGGSANTNVIVHDKPVSEAHVVTEALHRRFNDALNQQPQLLTEPKFSQILARNIRDEILQPMFSQLENTYAPTRVSTLKGSVVKPFATTISTVVVSDEPSETLINCAYGGDSPIIIITPEKIFSTYRPGMGEVANDDGIYRDRYDLKSGQVLIPKKLPFIALCATDWILKLSHDPIGGAFSFIKESLANDGTQWPGNILANWRESLDNGGELDDATIAVYSRGNNFNFPDLSTLTAI